MTNLIKLTYNKNHKIKTKNYSDTKTYKLTDLFGSQLNNNEELVKISLFSIISSNEKFKELRNSGDLANDLKQISSYLSDKKPENYLSLFKGYSIDYEIIEKLHPNITSRIYPQIELSRFSFSLLESSSSPLNQSIMWTSKYDLTDASRFDRRLTYSNLISTLYHFNYIDFKSMLYFKLHSNLIYKKSLDVLQDALSEYLTNFHNYIKVLVKYINLELSINKESN